jgi:hypothetical protein
MFQLYFALYGFIEYLQTSLIWTISTITPIYACVILLLRHKLINLYTWLKIHIGLYTMMMHISKLLCIVNRIKKSVMLWKRHSSWSAIYIMIISFCTYLHSIFHLSLRIYILDIAFKFNYIIILWLCAVLGEFTWNSKYSALRKHILSIEPHASGK